MTDSDRVLDYLNETRALIARLDRHAVARAVELLFRAWQRGNTIYTCGNGGSASTAQHFAADLFKCAQVDGARPLRVMSLVDNMPLVSALTNDVGWSAIYVQQLETWWRPGDVLVAISVHGASGADRAGLWSQNLLRASEWTKRRAGTVIALVGCDGGELAERSDVSILVPSNETSQVEGLHLVLHHLIAALLRERIAVESSVSVNAESIRTDNSESP